MSSGVLLRSLGETQKYTSHGALLEIEAFNVNKGIPLDNRIRVSKEFAVRGHYCTSRRS
jgi:hypothetical protein